MRQHASQDSFDEPSQDPSLRLKQLQTITAAYRLTTSSEPALPLPNSPLPALLALRSTLNTIHQSKASIKETNEKLQRARLRLHQERNDLDNARELTVALEKRIENLRVENEETLQKTLAERANVMALKHREKERNHVIETRQLVKAFNTFVDEHLAAMVAAEDLGGPVVGDLIGVDAETLKAGFTQRGKPKKAKGGSVGLDAERNRRNVEIWGSEALGPGQELRGEKEAAGADFRSLTEDLLNAAADEENADSYIEITRESAAVRFLVRAKVAQFDPDDARKLRLLDFGKELND